MKFGSDWRLVLTKAWSVRFIGIAVLLTVLDIGAVILEAFGLLADRLAVSLVLRSLSAVFGVAAFVARLVVQQGID